MNYFKLSLLIPRFEKGMSGFVADTISEVYDQQLRYARRGNPSENTQEARDTAWTRKVHSGGWSYAEKVTRKGNSQTTLTFQMNRFVSEENEWKENPFVRNVVDGSQLWLNERMVSADGRKLENYNTLFTVTKVSYDIKENNIIYTYTCQDSFTYQTIRQNVGYTVKNDIEDENFLGARTMDSWASNTILKDCHLAYNFLPFNKGLCLTTSDKLRIFDDSVDFLYLEPDEEVIEVLKDPMTKADFAEYYEPIIFQCSNASANAALIKLSGQLNCQICVAEYPKEEQGILKFDRFFWFEPQQNEQRLGLKYSPRQSIQSFGLTHSGDSLTTVLNIEAEEAPSGEKITMLPSLPSFFFNYFSSGQKWDNSKYTPGLFTSLCQDEVWHNDNTLDPDVSYKRFKIITDGEDDDILDTQEDSIAYIKSKYDFTDIWNFTPVRWYEETGWWYFPINSNNIGLFEAEPFYNCIDFSSGDLHSSIKHKDSESSQQTNTLFDYSSKWRLVIYDDTGEVVYVDDTKSFTGNNRPKIMFISIYYPVGSIETISDEWFDADIHLRFYRNVTEEELEFARIADSCPWLENKIIDFTYFLEQRIISPQEYNELLDILHNDLRIVNGKLLTYSKSYSEAIESKIKELAALQGKVDVLGAEVQSEVIDEIERTGSPKKDLSGLKEAYSAIRSIPADKNILSRNELLTTYFTKYWNSQQRFLKNIYKFEEFFNSPVTFGGQDLYRYTLTLTNTPLVGSENNLPSTYTFYTFDNWNLSKVDGTFSMYLGYSSNGHDNESLADYGKPLTNIVEIKDGQYCQIPIVYSGNYKNFYQIEGSEDGYVKHQTSSGENFYNNKTKYYEKVYHITLVKNGDNYYFEGDDQHTLPISLTTTLMASPVELYVGPYKIKQGVNETICYLETIKENENSCYGVFVPVIHNDSAFIEWDTQTSILISPVYLYQYQWQNWSLTSFQLNMLDFEMRPVSYSSMITNYVMRSRLESNIIYTYRDPNFFEPVSSLFTSNTLFRNSFLGSQCCRIFNPILTPDEFKTIENYQDYKINRDSSTLATSWKIYMNHFPVSEVYFLGPKNRINNESDQTSYKYKVYRLNKSGQTQEDYIKFLTGKSLIKINNPYEYQEYQSIPLVTPENQSEYYRRIHGSVAGQVWSGIATGLVSLALWPVPTWAAASAATYNALWEFGPTWFEKSGYCNKDFFGDNTTSFYDFPSSENSRILFARGASSYTTYKNLQIVEPSDTDSSQLEYNKFYQDVVIEDGVVKYKRFSSTVPTLDDVYKPIYAARLGDNIGLTYAGAINNYRASSLFYREKFAKLIKGNGLLKKDGNYKVLWNEDSILDFTNSIVFNSPGGFSLVKLYPIANFLIPFRLDEVDWQNGETRSLTDVLVDAGWAPQWDSMKPFVTLTDGTKTVTAIFVEIVDYKQTAFDWSDTFPFNWGSQDVYDTNELKINPIGISDFTIGYYSPEDGADAFNFASSFNKEGIYYTLDRKRAYTIYQLMNGEKDGYYLNSLTYTEDSFNPVLNTFMPPLLKNTADVTWTVTTEGGVTQYYYTISSIKTEKASEVGPLQFEPITVVPSYFVYEAPYETVEEPNYLGHKNAKFEQFVYEGTDLYLLMNRDPYFGVMDSYVDRFKFLRVTTFRGKQYYEWQKVEMDQLIQTFLYTDPFSLDGPQYLFDNGSAISVKKEVLAPITTLTNGAFWVKYHADTEHPLLFEHSAAIETQLTTYWDQAYAASKNCEYFLPENWRVSTEQSPNYFSTSLYFFTDIQHDFIERDPQHTSVRISHKLIPSVKIQSNERTRYVLSSESGEATASDKLGNNTAFKNALAAVGSTLGDWYVTEAGTTTYYYAESNTGMTWRQFISEATGEYMDKLNGNYPMMYETLKDYYTEREMIQYKQLVEQHDAIWDYLFTRYPGIILQGSYKPEGATTSSEVYTAAKYAFKGYSKPEAAYNISLINSYELEGYHGQHLRLGDGIRVAADEYYNEYDQIYQSLIQYLFITQITYDLRNPANLSIGVNAINYQDKMIQRLAKLIK